LARQSAAEKNKMKTAQKIETFIKITYSSQRMARVEELLQPSLQQLYTTPSSTNLLQI
jgi:hypothetical protein